MKLARPARDCVLEGFHEGHILGNIVVLIANPLGDAYRSSGAAADHDPNARRTRISQASAVHIGHQLCHHFNFSRRSLHCALNLFHRQDDYLVPFQRLAVALRAVDVFVQKALPNNLDKTKFFPYNRLHFPICTAANPAFAPKLCVDFYEASAKVACVDGRKGWHNNTEPVRSRLSDQPGGATRKAARPEKTDGSARVSWGLGLRKQ